MKILSHPRFLRVAGLLGIDALLFGFSDPQNVPSFMLAAAFILLIITTYQLVLAVLMIANWYGLPGQGHRRRQARVVTGVFGSLIALQSIGELGLRDVIVLLPLAFIAYLYISYNKTKSAPVAGQRLQHPVEPLLSLD